MSKSKKSPAHRQSFLGVEIPRSLSTGGRVYKRFGERGGCILENAAGAAIARFCSEQLLDEWCQKLQEVQRIKLEIIPIEREISPKTPKHPPKVFNGVAIPLSVRKSTHFVKYKLRNSWALATLQGNHMAHFPTEIQLDNWWRQFQKTGWAEPDASLSFRGEDGVLRSGAGPREKALASPPITQAIKDKFAEAMLFAFFEFHPKFRRRDISLEDFFLILKSCFSKDFVSRSLSSIAASDPLNDEAAYIAWVYHQFERCRTIRTRSIKESFEAVAKLLTERSAARRAAFRVAYEH